MNIGVNFNLGVLDQSPVRYNDTYQTALHESIELAKICEKIGYVKYWVAEQHNSKSLACASPEILLSKIASSTSTMEIGSGGIMIQNYSALKVAEQYLVLDAIYPGRISLGIGKAKGTDELGALALAYPRSIIDSSLFSEQVRDVLYFLGYKNTKKHAFSKLKPLPNIENMNLCPKIWLLGSSPESAKLAASSGINFAIADFLTPRYSYTNVANLFKRDFRASIYQTNPEICVALDVVCAPTEEEAMYLASSQDLVYANSLKEIFPSDGLLPPEEAIIYLEKDKFLREILKQQKINRIIGNPIQVINKIKALAKHYHAQYVLILTNCYSLTARVTSYKLIAQGMNNE